LLIREKEIPDWELVYDQQYSKVSGNLAVIYKDAYAIYNGYDGELINKRIGLHSVFYTPYGINVLCSDGQLQVIDLDTGEALSVGTVSAVDNFAAYCGIIVDSEFLDGRNLIGAAKTAEGYIFAVSDEVICTIYDGTGNRKFDITVNGQAQAYFTVTAVVISPSYDMASAYSLKSGKKLSDLEINLTYVVDMGGYIVCQYLTSDGKQDGILLDNAFQPIAGVPYLCDTWDGQIVFDYNQGVLRSSRVYGLEELVEMARAWV
jgi:hypothetical protein